MPALFQVVVGQSPTQQWQAEEIANRLDLSYTVPTADGKGRMRVSALYTLHTLGVYNGGHFGGYHVFQRAPGEDGFPAPFYAYNDCMNAPTTRKAVLDDTGRLVMPAGYFAHQLLFVRDRDAIV